MASRNRGVGAYRSGWRKKGGEGRRWTTTAEDGDGAGGSDATEGGGKRGDGGGEGGRRSRAVGEEECGRVRMKKKPAANSGRVPTASKTKAGGKTADEEDTDLHREDLLVVSGGRGVDETIVELHGERSAMEEGAGADGEGRGREQPTVAEGEGEREMKLAGW